MSLLYFTLFIVYVLIINVVSCPPGALIWKINYLVSCSFATTLLFNIHVHHCAVSWHTQEFHKLVPIYTGFTYEKKRKSSDRFHNIRCLYKLHFIIHVYWNMVNQIFQHPPSLPTIYSTSPIPANHLFFFNFHCLVV